MAPSHDITRIFLPLAVSAIIVSFTIVIHALALVSIVRFVRREFQRGLAGVWFWKDVSIVSAVALVAFAAHLLEIGLWAQVFMLCGEFTSFASAFYLSAETYTTLGDGDVMSAAWRLMVPLEAGDGMLMFGVSTAMLFAVIQRLIQTRYGEPGA